jgi:hypothetical protein
MKNNVTKITISLLLLFGPTILFAQTDDYRDKSGIDAAFKAELETLGFENGVYPEIQDNDDYTITDNLIHISVASALAPDGSIQRGHVPHVASQEDVVHASALACAASINILKKAAGGDLSHIRKVANIRYKTLTVPEYFDYVPASNACSEMMVRVFGRSAGTHTRHAEGLENSDGNQTFQIELVAYLK